MAIKTNEEIMNSVRTLIGEENTSDEAIAFIEDVQDTLNDYSSQLSETTDWKKKFEENDKEWRKKYTDRFFNKGGNDTAPIIDTTGANEGVGGEGEVNESTPKTFEELFKEKETK